jgi:hypothetical protein
VVLVVDLAVVSPLDFRIPVADGFLPGSLFVGAVGVVECVGLEAASSVVQRVVSDAVAGAVWVPEGVVVRVK